MERVFGIVIFLIGYIMMATMILDSLGVIDRAGPVAAVTFLVFGYLLCITGFLFVRRASPYE